MKTTLHCPYCDHLVDIDLYCPVCDRDDKALPFEPSSPVENSDVRESRTGLSNPDFKHSSGDSDAL
jgi:hypothetical protein